MYPNIPTKELPHILSIMCKQQNIPPPLQQEIISISELILKQNYFKHRNTTLQQNEGLAMGTPTSSIFSEIYLQYLEDSQLFNILTHHQIVWYFRYVDDILILYKPSTTSIHTVLQEFNNISPTIQFTMEEELNNNINFLDLSITRLPNQLNYLTIYTGNQPPLTRSSLPVPATRYNINCPPFAT
jgi:hypothetical protein